MGYVIRALVIVIGVAVLLLDPVVVVSPSGASILALGAAIDLAAVVAIALAIVTWHRRTPA